MTNRELILRPAVLFAPANRPEIIPKAAARADMVILDLEDGAGSIDRNQAYANIRNAGLDPATTFVRIVGPEDPHHAVDLAFVKTTEYYNVIVPKIGAALPEGLDGLNVVPIIETPLAVINIASIAADPHVVGLYWGADDLTIALGGLYSRRRIDEPQPSSYRAPIEYARVQTLLHAAANGKWALDAVYQDFKDLDGLYTEALDSAVWDLRHIHASIRTKLMWFGGLSHLAQSSWSGRSVSLRKRKNAPELFSSTGRW